MRFLHSDKHDAQWEKQAGEAFNGVCKAKDILLDMLRDHQVSGAVAPHAQEASWTQDLASAPCVSEAMAAELARAQNSQEESAMNLAMKLSSDADREVTKAILILDETLARDGARRSPIPGDGRCLLVAFLLGVFSNDGPASMSSLSERTLRDEVCAYLSKHRHQEAYEGGPTWAHQIKLQLQERRKHDKTCPACFDEYLTDMKDSGRSHPTWCDEFTLILLATKVACRRPIRLYSVTPGQEACTVTRIPEHGFEDMREVRMTYLSPVHYDAAVDVSMPQLLELDLLKRASRSEAGFALRAALGAAP